MRRVFGLYMDGSSAGQVAKGTGVSQGSVSVYLNEIEAAIGCKVLRWRAGVGGIAKAVKADSSVLRSERAEGLRRASVRDFHSLRVTWVTLALTAGVPLELVQRVTGHKTTDVVLKHYFRPGQEDFRLALEGAMPKLLTTSAGAVTAVPAAPRQELREAVERLATGAVREALLRELDRPR
jgi:hypothetical protein